MLTICLYLFSIYSRDIELRNQKRIEKVFSPKNKNLPLGLLKNFLVPGIYPTSEEFLPRFPKKFFRCESKLAKKKRYYSTIHPSMTNNFEKVYFVKFTSIDLCHIYFKSEVSLKSGLSSYVWNIEKNVTTYYLLYTKPSE